LAADTWAVQEAGALQYMGFARACDTIGEMSRSIEDLFCLDALMPTTNPGRLAHPYHQQVKALQTRRKCYLA